MIKRIAVVSDGDSFYEAVVEAAKEQEAQVVRATGADAAPAGTAVVLAGGGDASKALKTALACAAQGEGLLCLLAEAIDCRESFSPGSSLRVRDHAMRFADALGLSEDDRFTLERGALVRDIGKLKVPNNILLKGGLLTYEEWDVLHKHPHFGADAVQEVGALRDTVDIVRRHHECYDGTGYPDGLEGEAIPFLARVMRILDVYCAMTSERHYRNGFSTHDEAIEYIQEEKGKHFDPDLAQVFIDAQVGRCEGPSGA